MSKVTEASRVQCVSGKCSDGAEGYMGQKWQVGARL